MFIQSLYKRYAFQSFKYIFLDKSKINFHNVNFELGI